MNKPSTYTIGHIIYVKGLQAQVLSISEEYPNGFGGEYRMIGVQYLSGIRSAIYEECEPEPESSAEIGARNFRLMIGDTTAADWDEAEWSRIVD